MIRRRRWSSSDRYYFEKHRSPNGDALLKSERHRWNLLMRTKIRRPNGNEVCVGAIPADALTKHDIGAFQEVHRRVRTEQITDRRGRKHLRTPAAAR